FAAVDGERRWLARKAVDSPPIRTHPDTTFPVLNQRKYIVVVETRGIRRVVPVPGQQPPCAIESDHAVGLCGEPQPAAPVLEDSRAAAHTGRSWPLVKKTVRREHAGL